MQRINWRIAAAGLSLIALILIVAVWRSGGSSVVVAGSEGSDPTPTESADDAEVDVELETDPNDGAAEDLDGDSATDDPPDTAAPSGAADSATSEDPPAPTAPDTSEPDGDGATSEDPPAPTPPDEDAEAESASGGDVSQFADWDMRCILYLHGAGTGPGVLSDEVWADDLLYLTPHSGNNEFPFFWLYDGPHNMANDPNDSTEPFDQIVGSLTAYLDANECGPVMMHGESNGGGLAARIYCSGEDFSGRLWMAIIDDPVPDAGVVGCSPSLSVQRSLFIHSTEVVTLSESYVDNRCSISDEVEYPWYCMDDIGFDLDEYEAHLGQESILGRPEHIGINDDSVNFWVNVHGWWESFDRAAYTQHIG